MGYAIGYPKFSRPAATIWPGASKVFQLSEIIFGSMFTLEIVIKVLGQRLDFLYDWWNWFDSFVVAAWLTDRMLTGLPIDAMLLRIARLCRLLRLLRLVRTVQGFDALYILTTSLRGSLSVLLWGFLLLFLMQLMFAFILNQALMPYAMASGNISDDTRLKLFEYFGSCSRAMLTMFELSLGNWPPVARMLQEEVNEWFSVAAIAYKVTIGFSVLGVVNGVFTQETFKVASQDDAIMMRQTESKRKAHVSKMSSLFHLADSSGDGYLSKDEFVQTVSSRKIDMACCTRVSGGHDG
eukprot:TRINITY_DN9832_c0_g1_i1.p1 TRINITY_DN9832_c0_g1~~TRINITY_DN9832_c0_g1_i1.p1  ORF type:complete len:339 (-),score=35.34 TRINITY_DN9832_c0_g1_i1:385-1269(-)